MVAVDVGAGIGSYSGLFIDIVGREGEVHAFEPDPVNFRLLSAAVPSSDNVFLNQTAVGHQSGDITLYVSRSLHVDHRTYGSGGTRSEISVPCVALDDYFSDGATVDFIKIDIQGYEYYALSGMERVLQENGRVKILMEYFPFGLQSSGHGSAELRAFLAEKAFSLYSVSAKGSLIPLHDREPKLNSLGYTSVLAQRS